MFHTLTNVSRSVKTQVRQRLSSGQCLLAIACLLVPTIFTKTLDCEMMELFRAVLGVVAFVVVMQPQLNSTESLFENHGQKVKQSEQSRQPQSDRTEMQPLPASSNELKEAVSHDSTAPEEKSPESTAASMQFTADDLVGQMSELMVHLETTPVCLGVARDLRRLIEHRLSSCMPGSEVRVLVTCPFLRSTPYAAAVPEIEVVVSASFDQLFSAVQCLGGRRQSDQFVKLEPRTATKTALRLLVKHLLASTNFKFRRSSFASPEAKVTLVAANIGNAEHLPAFDLLLNARQPVRNSLLIAECAQLHPSAKSVLLAVRRWAKVRGICNASMGYLPPYAWTLLVIYYLQVSDIEESLPLLPPLHCSKSRSGEPMVIPKGRCSVSTSGKTASTEVAILLTGFMTFYSEVFDWSREEVCIIRGCRSLSSKGGTQTIRVRDPFQDVSAYVARDSKGPADGVSACGIQRMRQELDRACNLLRRETGPLPKLLEQWVPELEEQLPEPQAL